MPNGILWTTTLAKQRLQAHYDLLAQHLNSVRPGPIQNCYLETSTIYKEGQKYVGKAEALKFWLKLLAQGKKNFKFTVKTTKLIPVFWVEVTMKNKIITHKIVTQKVYYAGIVTFDGPSGDPSGKFAGSGSHISPCSLDGGPDSENFSF